jgi:hypothetical protein
MPHAPLTAQKNSPTRAPGKSALVRPCFSIAVAKIPEVGVLESLRQPRVFVGRGWKPRRAGGSLRVQSLCDNRRHATRAERVECGSLLPLFAAWACPGVLLPHATCVAVRGAGPGPFLRGSELQLRHQEPTSTGLQARGKGTPVTTASHLHAAEKARAVIPPALTKEGRCVRAPGRSEGSAVLSSADEQQPLQPRAFSLGGRSFSSDNGRGPKSLQPLKTLAHLPLSTG